MEAVLVIKNVPVKFCSFFNGGNNGDQEGVSQTLQLLQWTEYWLPRTCLSNSSASSMEVIMGIKKVSLKLFSSFNGRSIGDQELDCQTLQLPQWMEYCWPRTCLSNASASLREGVLVIKNVSVKFYSFFNWREYWWSWTCLPNSSVSSVEGLLVMKNVSAKLFSFFNGGSIGDEERSCQPLQLHKWREYWWWRTCLSNSSANLLAGVLVIKNWPVKLFSIFNGGIICDQERVCQTLQFLQWRENWKSRMCLPNSPASLRDWVLVIKNLSVKLFSTFNGRRIGDQEGGCQTLQLH